MASEKDVVEVQELSDGWFGKAETGSSNGTFEANESKPTTAATSTSDASSSAAGSMASIYATASSNGGDTPRASPRIAAQKQTTATATTSTSPPGHARAPRPPKITLPSASQSMAAHLAGRLSAGTPRGGTRTPIAQTPLSENHPVPETPLKHDWQNGASNEIALTPRSEEAINGSIASRQTRGGLLLDPGTGLLPQALQTPPVTRSFQLQSPDGLGISSTTTRSSPLPASLPPRPQAYDAASRAAAPSPPPIKQSSAATQKSNIDDMLARLRLARAAGSGASMWAPKAEDNEAGNEEASAAASTSKGGAMSPPPAPARKQQEKSARRSRESSEGAKGDKPSKSLLERLGPAPASQPTREEAIQLAPDSSPEVGSRPLPRTRRERKTPTRSANEEIPPGKSLLDRFEASPPATSTPEKSRRETRRRDKLAEASNGDRSPMHEHRASAAREEANDAIASNGKQQTSSPVVGTAKSASPPTPMQHASNESMLADTSIISEAPAEVGDDSTIGNDTMSSINWADDDDDESLPELPEDWTRQTPQPSSSPEDTSSATNLSSPNSGSAKRNIRRAGRGRNARQGGNAEGGDSRNAPGSPQTHRTRNAGKELFGTPASLPKMASDASGMRMTRKSSSSNGKKEPRELFPSGSNGAHSGKNSKDQSRASSHENGSSRRRQPSGRSPKT